MLSLFTELLQSKKLSGPRLVLKECKPIAQKKRSRATSTKKLTKGQKEEDKTIEDTNNEINQFETMGIIQTENGYEYHPTIESDPKPKKAKVETKKKQKKRNTLASRQAELTKIKIKTHSQTPCKFYKKGRCTNKNCEFLHEGPPPLCYNLLKNGVCEDKDCIYNHDTKSVGCMFYHITHNCTKGENCRFSHDALTKEQLDDLQRIYDEIQMEKKSTMPVDVAKVILNDEKEEQQEKEKEKQELLEEVPSLMVNVEPIQRISPNDKNEESEESEENTKEESEDNKENKDNKDNKENTKEEENTADLFF